MVESFDCYVGIFRFIQFRFPSLHKQIISAFSPFERVFDGINACIHVDFGVHLGLEDSRKSIEKRYRLVEIG